MSMPHGVLEFPDVLVLVSMCVSCSCCCAMPSAMAMLQLSLPAVRVLLTWQHTTCIKLACNNATERVMLVRSPADQHVFHDELPGTRLTVDAHASQNHTCAGSSDHWSPF